MLSVQMLNQTALTAGRMLAVVLGANVGITISVQLLAFRLQDYSGIFLLAGGIGFLFLKRAIFRGAGQMLLGIGLVFLAMGIIGSAGTAAAANADLKLLFGVVDHYPLVVFIGTALLTVGLQSSTASIGLGIGLARSGLLPGTTIVPRPASKRSLKDSPLRSRQFCARARHRSRQLRRVPPRARVCYRTAKYPLSGTYRAAIHVYSKLAALQAVF
jgi:Na+/Pi-cotransporter